MGVAEKERKWARRVSELENLWGCEGVGGEGGACVCGLNTLLKKNIALPNIRFQHLLEFPSSSYPNGERRGWSHHTKVLCRTGGLLPEWTGDRKVKVIVDVMYERVRSIIGGSHL